MTAINGSDGNDNLVGTAQADRITPGLGIDLIDGRGGRDTLIVDYSSAVASVVTIDLHSGGEPQGRVTADSNQVEFNSIEAMKVELGDGDQQVVLGGDATIYGVDLDLDAGGGTDHLVANFAGQGPIDFRVGPSGKVKVGDAVFSNFESFELTLGEENDFVKVGDNNDVIFANGGDDEVHGGAGNDAIFGGTGTNSLFGGEGDDSLVSNGVDLVSGGSGLDYWQGDYRFESENLTFNFNGQGGSLSNGTSLDSIESVAFFGGSGDDIVSISGAAPLPTGASSAILFAGSGFDTLDADVVGDGSGTTFISIVPEDGELGGGVYGLSFDGFESVNISGDGAMGSLSLFVEDDLTVVIGDDGSLSTDIGVTLSNYAAYEVQLGSGNDNAFGSSRADIIRGEAGNDMIWGGGGADFLVGGEGADTFIFESGDLSNNTSPFIGDFSSVDGDKIDLQRVLPDGEFAFIGNDAFSGSGAAELQVTEFGQQFYLVQGDTDGNGEIDFAIYILGTLPPAESDFLL